MAKKQKNPRERFSYLRDLVTEFQDSSSTDAKEQVLANLANFAYDPDNYSHFKELNIVDLFLDQLEDENENFVEYAIGGICNLVLDKTFKEYIFKRGGVSSVIKCLSSSREETVLSAVSTLMFLVYPESKPGIVTPSVIDCMLRFQKSNNRRLSNLASVFLQDYCSPREIENAKQVAASYEEKTVLKEIIHSTSHRCIIDPVAMYSALSGSECVSKDPQNIRLFNESAPTFS